MADDVAQLLDPKASNKDTINHKVVPIIVVPGVMGTRLDFQGAAPNWDPDSRLAMSDLAAADDIERLKFLNPGPTPSKQPFRVFGAKATKQIEPKGTLIGLAAKEDPKKTVLQVYTDRGWTQACWEFYGEVLIQLEDKLNTGRRKIDMPVYCVGYDWRESNVRSGARLVGEIDRILARHKLAKKVIIVTHSMGGLVTRAAMAISGFQKIAGVVHCMLPADGAVVAYRRFQTGANTPFDVAQPNSPVAETIATAVLNRIMGAERVSYAAIQSVLAGPLQLLPNNAYNGLFLTLADGSTNNGSTINTIANVYQVYAQNSPPGLVPNVGESSTQMIWQAGDTVNLRQRIAAADAFHSQIQGVFHPNTFLRLGDGLTTDVEFDWRAGLTGQRGNTADLQLKVTQTARQGDPRTGDGTVPAISALCPAVQNPLSRITFPNVAHSECFKNQAFRDQVEADVRTLFGLA